MKSDRWIKTMAQDHEMISDFEDELVRKVDGERVVSFGCSSYGYDIRAWPQWKVFTNTYAGVVDPKNFCTRNLVEINEPVCVIPPNSFVLARSYEYFRIPRRVMGIVLGKSTYARCGVNVIATPLEPEWHGHITLEFCNTTPLPVKIYANEGVAQVIFLESDEDCQVSYQDRGGKYQGQTGIQEPIT